MAQHSPSSQDLPASYPWIDRLIRLQTISETSNLELVDLLDQEFTRHGIRTHRTYSDDGTRANLFATVPSQDGSTDGGVVLSGHTDVVPVENQPWDTDPFEPVLKGSRLYGRGVADMKSFIAVAMWLLPRIAEARLSEPLHFAFSYDEEIGCVGAPRMIEEFRSRGIRPAYCVVGEPSLMNVIQSHKASQRGRITFRGVPKHSSMALYGINAVHYAGEFIHFYKELADGWRENGPFDDGFEIPHTTGGVNFANGGIAYNIVAEECVLEYDFRAIPANPDEDLTEQIRRYLFDELEPAMHREVDRVRGLGGADQKALDQVGISHEVLANVPALSTGDEDPVIELGTSLGARFGGTGPEGTELRTRVPYGTEGGQFQQGGVPTIVCGPGDIAQAHTANEWVDLSQIRACEDFMEKLLERATAGGVA